MSHSGVLALSANSPVIYHRQDFLSLHSIQSRSWTAGYLGCRSVDCLFWSWTIYTLLGMFDFWKLPEISIHNRLKFAHLIPCCLSNKEESTRYSSRSFFSYRRNQRLLSKENMSRPDIPTDIQWFKTKPKTNKKNDLHSRFLCFNSDSSSSHLHKLSKRVMAVHEIQKKILQFHKSSIVVDVVAFRMNFNSTPYIWGS